MALITLDVMEGIATLGQHDHDCLGFIVGHTRSDCRY